jgi:thiamine pyrophosphokinase
VENENNDQRLDEIDIFVSIYETTLISNILQVAISNLRMDEDSRKRIQNFKYKLEKARLSITKRYLDSLQKLPSRSR